MRSSLAAIARAVAPVAVAAGCASTAPPPVAVPVGGDAHAGGHFAIICHFACGSAGERALRASELAWQHAAELLGVDVAPTALRPIHLYRTEQEYEEIEAELTGGRFRLNRAMTYRGVEAHISVHPNLTRTALREFGLTSNTLRVVAHEAAHMALRAQEPRTRAMPDWFDEGLASSLELDVLIEMGQAESRTDEPVSSTRLHLLRERVLRGAMPPLAELLEGDEAGLTLAERYAFYQHFMDFLRAGRYRPRLERMLRTLGEVGGSSREVRARLVAGILGPDPEAVDSADAAFRAWLLARDPAWVQTRRALSTAGPRWIQVGFQSGAEAWRWNPRADPPYVLRGAVRILEDAGGTASVLVALRGNARLAVVFASDELRLERSRFAGDPRPDILVRRPRAADVAARQLSFRIAVDSAGVTASIGAEPPLRIDVPTDSRWGLATGPGANVVWSDIAMDAAR